MSLKIYQHNYLYKFVILGGAPNYYPNSFSGPLDHPTHALSKTIVVNTILLEKYNKVG